MHYYEVGLTRIVRQDHQTFTYESEGPLSIGQLVLVDIGKKQHLGIIVSSTKKPKYATKPIVSILDMPPLPAPLLQTALWISAYYATHLALVLQTVLPRGITKKRRHRETTQSVIRRSRTHLLLNPEQQEALHDIAVADTGTVILHGVTGSGKTAVYIERAKTVLASGKSVIILVPEIALTSQVVSDFHQHFEDIIVTHSGHTEAERHQSWLDALTSSKPRVVIGPRSALFIPVAPIGLIVIDEAHEPSYKQDQSPRYSALRVASVLAHHHRAVVVQGSATPLISEYYLAKTSDRPIIHMRNKAQTAAAEPDIELVDMTKRGNFSIHRHFSDRLLMQINQTLANNTQVLIFHNRRGSASTTLCEQCGWSAICPRCFVPFTLHADQHRLRCHICGLGESIPTSCPVCTSTDIIHKGIGTKLIEAELRRLYPGKTIARFDGDATNAETLEKRYQEIYDGSIDIIIGTQVIAKGLDLPLLRMVGVIQADSGLSLPDFTSSERVFQLLAQVVGRVGRNHHATTIVVQSYQPQHPAVQLGIKQDYETFYDETIDLRQRSKFPPFTHLMKLTCIYKTEAVAIRHCKVLAEKLKAKYPTVTLFGPVPAFYERQHDTYRWQIVVKSHRRGVLLDLLGDVPPTHWQADIDPMSLL